MNTKTTIFGLILIFLILNVLDIITTVYAVKNGFEANPAMAYLQSLDWGLWMAVKLLVGFVIAFAIYMLYIKHVKAARITTMFLILFYALIVVNNAVVSAEECSGVFDYTSVSVTTIESPQSGYVSGGEYTFTLGETFIKYTYDGRLVLSIIVDGFSIYNGRNPSYTYYVPSSSGACTHKKTTKYFVLSGIIKAGGRQIGGWSAYWDTDKVLRIYATYSDVPEMGELVEFVSTGVSSHDPLECKKGTIRTSAKYRPSSHLDTNGEPTVLINIGGGVWMNINLYVTDGAWKAYYTVQNRVELKANINYKDNILTVNITEKDPATYYLEFKNIDNITFQATKANHEYLIPSPKNTFYLQPEGNSFRLSDFLECYEEGEAYSSGKVILYFFDAKADSLLDSVNFTLTGDDFSDSGVYNYKVTYTSDQLMQGNSYNYTASRDGYQSVSGSFTFTGGQVIKLYFIPDLTNPNATEHVSDPVNNTALTFTVLDSETKEPLEGATVMVEGYSKLTNANGFTWFEVVKNATYHYTVSKNGYYSISGSVAVGANQTDVTVELIPISTTTTTTITAGAGTGGGTTGGGEDTTQNAVDTLKANAESIVSLCILGTIIGLLRIMTMRR